MGDPIKETTAVAKIPPTVKPRKKGWIELAPVSGWVSDWVHWLASQDHQPTVNEQVNALRKYSKQDCGTNALSLLKRRDDVATLLQRLSGDRAQLARAILVRNAPADLDLRRQVLHQAAAEMQGAETTKERMIAAKVVLSGTEGLLNKVWPTKEEHAPQAPIVVINLGNPSGFAARHAQVEEGDLPPLPTVDYEIVRDEATDR